MKLPPTNSHGARPSRSRSEPAGNGNTIVWIFLAAGVGSVLLILVACGVGALFIGMAANRQARVMQEKIIAEQNNAANPFGNPGANLRRPEFGANPALTPIIDLPGFIAKNLQPNNQQVGPLAPNSAVWTKIRAGVAQNRLMTNPTQGGGFNDPKFRDVPPDTGILIGLFACAPDNHLVHYIQPIFLTPQGERAGPAHGQPEDYVVCLKAKKGYAVGAMEVHFGAAFDSFTLIFMKVKADGLDPTDSYQSIQIGGDGGGLGRLGGDGSFIVGLHGATAANNGFTPAGSINSLGVLSIK